MAVPVPERLGDLNIEKKADDHINKLMDKGIEVSNITVNAAAGTVSYYEHDPSELALTKSQKEQLQKMFGRKTQLPKEYKSPFRQGFTEYLRTGLRNPSQWETLTKSATDRWAALGMITKADAYNRIDSDSAGALVLPEFAPNIAEIPFDEMDFWQQGDNYSISGSGIKLPRAPGRSRKSGQRNSGVTAGWPDEGDLIATTRGRLETTELSLKKMAVVVFYTQELLDDESYALETWVTKQVRNEFQFLLNDAMFTGSGGGMPLGWLKSGALLKVNRKSAGLITADDVLNMYSHIRTGVPTSDYQWLINQECMPQLQLMTIPNGVASPTIVYTPPGGLSASPYAALMGLPLKMCEFSEALGTTGDLALIRLKGYVTISKGGINETPSSHVGFMRDQEAVKFTRRVDGRPMYDSPTETYKGTAGFSNADFIALT